MESCSKIVYDTSFVNSLDYSIVDDIDYPDAIKKIIEENKSQPVFSTYMTNDFLYIIIGYGPQPTDGYSVAINRLFESANAIIVDSTLIGPSKDMNISSSVSYPVTVLKLSRLDKDVIFT